MTDDKQITVTMSASEWAKMSAIYEEGKALEIVKGWLLEARDKLDRTNKEIKENEGKIKVIEYHRAIGKRVFYYNLSELEERIIQGADKRRDEAFKAMNMVDFRKWKRKQKFKLGWRL